MVATMWPAKNPQYVAAHEHPAVTVNIVMAYTASDAAAAHTSRHDVRHPPPPGAATTR